MSDSADQKKPTTQRRSRVSRGGAKAQQQSNNRRGYRKRNDSNNAQGDDEEEDIPEDEQCLICAEKMEVAALTPCNHTTCHKCTFRQRSLYEKSTCLICRTENDKIIITEQIHKDFGDITDKDIVATNDKYNIEFTSKLAEHETLKLLENICCICHETFPDFKPLIDHAKEVHNKFYCLICSKFKKAFKLELPLFTYKQLQKHQIEGDGDESGFTGHPNCKHCQGKRFYSEDELNVHIRDRHERCHICDQLNPKTADYYRNYDSLYNHFTKSHYVCTVSSCVEKRFVVFRDDLDLTAHMLKEHGGLTGNNNRVIIGSNTQHFSQLSTFDSRRSANNGRWMGEDDEVLQQSPEIKKKRFEERARHYLNYNSDKFNEFKSLNNNFKNKSVTANELFNLYKQNLFIHQTQEELNLLIKEFQEFFPKNSDFHKDLSSIIKENVIENFPVLGAAPTNDNFPVLGGSRSGSTTPVGGQSWANGGSSSRNNSSSNVDKFPPLKAKPKKKVLLMNTSPATTTRTIIRPVSTTVKRPISTFTTAPVTVKAATKQNFPTLAKKSPSTIPGPIATSTPSSSVTSLPMMTGTSYGSVNSVSSSSSLPSSRNSSSTNLNNNEQFPQLPKKVSKKKVIPRVKQYNIPDPNAWGK
ncbi:E3 ubiquitin-protein ligase HEL2 [Candida tropicalis]